MFQIVKVWVLGFLLFKGLSLFVPQLQVGGFLEFGIFLLVLALINAIIKPLMNFFGFPLTVLTLGLFSTFINFFCLWLALETTGVIKIQASGLIWFLYLFVVSTILGWLNSWE